MKKIAISLLIAASSLLAVGQIDDTLLDELDQIAQQQEEGGTGMNPETAYYESSGMGAGEQMDEASQQMQQNTTQDEVESGGQDQGGEYIPPEEY
ncbi:MAG: hypothetical protein R3302_01270 [Sulfurimonadaceae bacterium]|nr:hypothetical protein [Sulfurimonadaceae bacterium]